MPEPQSLRSTIIQVFGDLRLWTALLLIKIHFVFTDMELEFMLYIFWLTVL